MKAFYRALALLLAALILPAAACRKAPAPEPTPEPVTQAPTGEYDFNAETLAYEDEYVSFTLPKGQTKLIDSTADRGEGYMRYLVFTDPDNADVSTSYCVQPAEDELYANFTVQDFEQLFKLFYERSLESEVTLETLRYEEIDGTGSSGVTYEYSVKYGGAEIRQLLYSVVTDAGISVTVAFTYADEAEARMSAESITIN